MERNISEAARNHPKAARAAAHKEAGLYSVRHERLYPNPSRRGVPLDLLRTAPGRDPWRPLHRRRARGRSGDAALAAGTVGALQSGAADVSLSGIMRSFELADRGDAAPVHFAAVNNRNGFFLLSRQAQPSFGWSDLIGRTVISFGGAPTPWLCMQSVLRRHGVDPARVTFLRGLSTEDAVAAFRARKGDFIEHGP